MQLNFKALEPRIKHRVLIVDDFPDAAEIISTLLAMLGHDTRVAHSGRAALEQVALFNPDLVLLDIGLPDLSGYEVARELRTRDAGTPMILAAMTGWGTPDDRVRAFAAGFDHHIVKPVDGIKLKNILELATACVESMAARSVVVEIT